MYKFLLLSAVLAFGWHRESRGDSLNTPCDRESNDQRLAQSAADAEYTSPQCRQQISQSFDACMNNNGGDQPSSGDSGGSDACSISDPSAADACTAVAPSAGATGDIGSWKSQCSQAQTLKQTALGHCQICDRERKKVASACPSGETDAGTLAAKALQDAATCSQNQATQADAQIKDMVTVMSNNMTASEMQGQLASPQQANSTLNNGVTNTGPQSAVGIGAQVASLSPEAAPVASAVGKALPGVGLITSAASGDVYGTTTNGLQVGGSALSAGAADGSIAATVGAGAMRLSGALGILGALTIPSPEPGPPECSSLSGLQAATSNCYTAALSTLGH